MIKKILSSFKLPKIFYIGLIPIIYFSIVTGVNVAEKRGIQKYTVEGHSAVTKIIPNFKLGITYGILMFFVLIAVWVFVSKLMSVIMKDNIFVKKFFILGEITVDNAITKLFYIGLILVAFLAYNFSRYLKLFWMYSNIDRNIYNYLFSSAVGFIIMFLIILVLWKLVCELLLVVFRCFEVYYDTKKNNLKE